mmetsp:Transcript_130447/g.260283  ORF Transcript_130447/g.260283 Transcript_130447/m.260283 type:complete len:224 (-) Transcript_130447:66-737(-)
MHRRASRVALLVAGFRHTHWPGPARNFVSLPVPRLPIRSQRCSSVRRLAVGMPNITLLTTEDAADKAQKIVDASKNLADAVTSVEEVKSYYWWEGKVNFDPEWRVAVTTSTAFDDAKEIISKAHSYDLPMIIYDLEQLPDDHKYWKGLVQLTSQDAITLAEKLVEQRIVACAQASPDGLLAVKTVASCKPMVEKSSEAAITWSPIGGNEGYLNWLEEECVGGK